MRKSVSDFDSYRNFCKLAASDENVFSTFKRSSIYTEILEHCSYEQGKAYLDWSLNNKNFNLDKLQIAKNNDKLGNATLGSYEYPIGSISPNSLRYLKVLLELESLFGNLSDKNIIEIGVGYGGQCKLITEAFQIKNYYLVDLEEPLALAKKYLNNESFHYLTMENLPENNTYDLVISNYAFSECNKDVQSNYIKNIIKNSKHGYITFNNISHFFNVDSYSKEELLTFFNFTEIIEYPLTSKDNTIFIW